MQAAADRRPPLGGTVPDSLSGPRRTCGEQSGVGQRFPWRTILILQSAKLFAFVMMTTVDSRAGQLLVLRCLHHTALCSVYDLASEHRRFSRVLTFTN